MNRTRKLISIVLVAILGISSEAAVAGSKENLKGKPWKVKFAPRSRQVGVGSDLTLTVGSDAIRLVGNLVDYGPSAAPGGSIQIGGFQFSIPIAKIADVSYSFREIPRPDPSCFEFALCTIVLAIGLFLPRHPKKHFVNIFWHEEGTEKVISLEASKRDYAKLLAELARVTGKTPQSLSLSVRAVGSEIKQNLDKRESIRFFLYPSLRDEEGVPQPPRCVTHWISRHPLSGRTYSFILLQREGGQGEIIFFSGEDMRNVVLMSPVEIIPRSNASPDQKSVVEYTTSSCTAKEIHTATQILRFPNAVPVVEFDLQQHNEPEGTSNAPVVDRLPE